MNTETPIKILNLTRVFDAPQYLVFRAWTEPELIAKWWGPHGFTCPRCQWDAKVGGTINLDMVGFNMDHPMLGEFLEVDRPNRLVFTARAFIDDAGNGSLEVHNTVTFKALGNKTEVTLLAVVTKATAEVAMALAGMDQGWDESLDKFGALVVGLSHKEAETEILTIRTFEAPRDLVWKAWTEPEHVKNWWGPNGFTTTIEKMDVTPGGMWIHTMHGPDGRDYPNMVKFLEVEKPNRLTYQHLAEGSEGVHHTSFVTFTEEDGRTTVEMHLVFSTAAEQKRVSEEYGARIGGIQHMANLAKYLNGIQ